MDHQHGQQRALLCTAQRHLAAAVDDLQFAQDPELEHRSVPQTER
jgi:hypothetical protein